MHQLRSRGEFTGGPPAIPSTKSLRLFYLSVTAVHVWITAHSERTHLIPHIGCDICQPNYNPGLKSHSGKQSCGPADDLWLGAVISAKPVSWEPDSGLLVRIADCTSNETAGVPSRLSCFVLAEWMPGGGGRSNTDPKDCGIDQGGNLEVGQPVPEMKMVLLFQSPHSGVSYWLLSPENWRSPDLFFRSALC